MSLQPTFLIPPSSHTPAIHGDGNLVAAKEHLVKAPRGARLNDAGYGGCFAACQVCSTGRMCDDIGFVAAACCDIKLGSSAADLPGMFQGHGNYRLEVQQQGQSIFKTKTSITCLMYLGQEVEEATKLK